MPPQIVPRLTVAEIRTHLAAVDYFSRPFGTTVQNLPTLCQRIAMYPEIYVRLVQSINIVLAIPRAADQNLRRRIEEATFLWRPILSHCYAITATYFGIDHAAYIAFKFCYSDWTPVHGTDVWWWGRHTPHSPERGAVHYAIAEDDETENDQTGNW